MKPKQAGLRSWLASTTMCVTLSLSAIIGLAPQAVQAATTSGPALTVDASANRHTISPYIYGIDFVDQSLAQQLGITADRWGGDATTRYNWLQDSSNSGGDWYFTGGNGNSAPVPGAQVDAMVTKDQTVGAISDITIPLIGYVNSTSQWNCSYPQSKYPNQQDYNPYIHPNGDNCGNGKDVNGNNIIDTDILANHIQVDSNWMKAWIQHLVQTHGTGAANGVQIYQMDNEPESWSNVHRDVHPQSTGFDEYLNRVIDYATMIHSVDPTAQILGPANWGVPAYFDMGLAGDDQTSHNQAWMPYFLSKLFQYQQQHGQRLLNYADVHYYGNASNSNEDAATDAQRLRSTRSLWDPTYTDESWIGQYFTPAEQIQLIPRLKAWIKQYYPGTKSALTEYNFGDQTGLNGALAQADALGIFGREGLDLAELWGGPSATDPGAYAFRMFRNFDGNGSQYGDTWIQSSSADQGQLAIYGSQRTRDNALTLVIVNKTGNDLTSDLALNHFNANPNALVYTYSGANLSAIPSSTLTVSNTGFSYTYPANSITTIVIPQQGTTYLGGAANNPAPSQKNSLQPDATTFAIYKNNTYPLVVTSVDVNGVGTLLSNSRVAFSSDNPAVATVDNNGVVTGLGTGTAHITGSYNGQSFTSTVTVIGVESITLSPTTATLAIGGQVQTAVTSNYNDDSTQPVAASDATFASDNTAIATVDKNGVVTAVSAGTTLITATYQNFKAATTITVSPGGKLPSGWQNQDIGAVTTAGNAVYYNGTYSVTGAGTDVYGQNDQGHFAYREIKKDASLIARVTGVQNVQGYAGGGLMIRDGLNSGANLVYLAMFPNGSLQVKTGSASTTTGITGVWGGNGSNSFPYWIKLDRADDVVTASYSADGKTWTQAEQIPFPTGKAYIGMFVTSHGAPIMNTTTFDNVSYDNKSSVPPVSGKLPKGWTLGNVGAVTQSANAGYKDGTFTLQAAGDDVYGTTDQEGFIYKTLPGDGSITARVATQQNTNDYAKSGVMIRDGLDAGANLALLALTPTGSAQLTTGSSTATGGISNTWISSTTIKAPYWLRLTRSGNTVTAFTSPDGVTWTQQAQATFATGQVYIGLEVDAHNNLLFATSTFDNVTTTGNN